MDDLFHRLRRAGVGRDGLVLAWDFTVSSGENLSERLLAMRDDAFGQLGRAAPAFTVTGNVPSTRANLAREVSGTFEVPNYLTGSGEPGAVLNNGNGPDLQPRSPPATAPTPPASSAPSRRRRSAPTAAPTRPG